MKTEVYALLTVLEAEKFSPRRMWYLIRGCFLIQFLLAACLHGVRGQGSSFGLFLKVPGPECPTQMILASPPPAETTCLEDRVSECEF